jgi:hypothetical protein
MQMRRQAVGLVQGLTGSPEGAQALSSASNELLPALLWLVGDSSQISKAALTSLVNLSQVSFWLDSQLPMHPDVNKRCQYLFFQ